jgi:hypothetical protein
MTYTLLLGSEPRTENVIMYLRGLTQGVRLKEEADSEFLRVEAFVPFGALSLTFAGIRREL